MNVVYSMKGIIEEKRPKQGCADMKNAGMTYALFDSKEAETVLRCAKEVGLKVPVAYAPQGLESLEFVVEAKIKKVIVRPNYENIPTAELWEDNRKKYLALAGWANENGIKILLENQCKEIGGHFVRGVCSDAVQACEWIDALNEDAGEKCFGFCLHVGSANLCGQNMYEMIKVLGDRLEAVILTDGDGHEACALLPFTCSRKGKSSTDWLGLIRGLREMNFDGELIVDYSDTAAAFSPILRPQLLQLVKATGDYFKWQIELQRLLSKYSSRVLFGAGNMCRNYMKCYGEEFPPLFTCDNNQKLWGTFFEGLEIKNPEELKTLPKDCAIFICNIYYREIEKQLRDMGIENPIEFFNDEYMPSFHFRRI